MRPGTKLILCLLTLALLVAPRAIKAQERLDIAALLGSGAATLSCSPYDIGSPGNLFDGNTATLLRSAAVNPLKVTLSFAEPQPVSRFRVWFLAGDNNWRVESADSPAELESGTGSYRLLVPWTLGGQAQWHEAAAAPSATVRCLRLSLQRLTGDNYVHLNEWEIEAPEGWFRITDFDYQPASSLASLTFGSRISDWYAVEDSPDRQDWNRSDTFKATSSSTIWQGSPAWPSSQWFWRVRPVQPEDRPAVTKRVLVLNYDPIIESQGGQRLHQLLGWGDPQVLTSQYLQDLHESSHGYVNWELVEFRTLDEWPLKADGFRYTDASYLACVAGQQAWHNPDGVDYENVIAGQGLDALVQSGAVDEVLMWGAPYFGYWESQMVGATAYWCNSGPLTHPGVPLYVIMGLNYERGVAEAIHSFGHRAESILWHVYGSWSSDGTIHHDWDRFTRLARHGLAPAGCGNVHFPVNGAADYDYANPALVLSDAEDWWNHPDFQGTTSWVNRESWGGPDYHRNYLNWWYARMPHRLGRGADGFLLNWWAYLVDLNEYPESR